jgi:phage replication initiation protein
VAAGAPPGNSAPANSVSTGSDTPILQTGFDSLPAPRTVIRGESYQGTPTTQAIALPEGVQAVTAVHPFAAHTDWLNCTIPTGGDPDFHSNFVQQLFDIAGRQFAPMTESGGGLQGWKRSFKLGETGARLAVGGQNDTLFLSLPGYTCTLIPLEAWPVLSVLLEYHYHARITRWDGAVDDYEGRYSVNWAVEQYYNNQFNGGGNRPSCDLRGNWLFLDGSGRTFYVGKRKNGKLIRIYEKGKQLGDPNSPWVRWEVELHNKQREIPWDVLVNPGVYVAGAYPCTRWVSEEASRIRTIQKTADIGYAALRHYARESYGRLINVMKEKGMSPEQIIGRLIRDGTPSRLMLPIPPEMKDPLFPEGDS